MIQKTGKIVNIGLSLLLMCGSVSAQVTVPEPKSLDSYSVLTSDSTFKVLRGSVACVGGEDGDYVRHISANSMFWGRVAFEKTPAGKSGDVKDIRLLARDEDNEGDPRERFCIVRFSNFFWEILGAEWRHFTPAQFGSEEFKKSGHINFSGQKYGERSYLLTIPMSDLKTGCYGIFRVNSVVGDHIFLGAFSVK